MIVVAEGAGQELLADPAGGNGTDASGNAKFKDIGLFLRDRITDRTRLVIVNFPHNPTGYLPPAADHRKGRR